MSEAVNLIVALVSLLFTAWHICNMRRHHNSSNACGANTPEEQQIYSPAVELDENGKLWGIYDSDLGIYLRLEESVANEQ